MTYAIPQRYDATTREPADPPTEPVEREPAPADCYESCYHQAACSRLWETFVEPIDTDGLAWMDRLAESMGCAECDEWEGMR